MPKILLIEDDPMLSEIYKRKLSSSGFDVEAAYTGKEALEKAEKGKFDLILLDLILPEMDGADVLRKLKSNGNGTKVAIFSVLSKEEYINEVCPPGADCIIPKTGLTPSDLIQQIREKHLINFQAS